jgi:hypothetical protein
MVERTSPLITPSCSRFFISASISGVGDDKRSDIGFHEDTRIRGPHFLARQYLRTKGIKPQFPNGIVSSVSFVSTTNTARSLARFVLLALALTRWRSPGSSGEALSSPCRSSPVRR